MRAELALAGVPASERDVAVARTMRAIERTLADPRGRWLFDPAHEERQIEWSLAGVDAAQVAHVALDHSFVSAGVRWIVDYKTGAHEGGDVDAFLDREVERYRPQLERSTIGPSAWRSITRSSSAAFAVWISAAENPCAAAAAAGGGVNKPYTDHARSALGKC